LRIIRKWIPLFSISGIFFFISCIFFFLVVSNLFLNMQILQFSHFQSEVDMTDRYFRLVPMGLVSIILFCATIFLGQMIENEVS
jgi:hypothetical protein